MMIVWQVQVGFRTNSDVPMHLRSNDPLKKPQQMNVYTYIINTY